MDLLLFKYDFNSCSKISQSKKGWEISHVSMNKHNFCSDLTFWLKLHKIKTHSYIYHIIHELRGYLWLDFFSVSLLPIFWLFITSSVNSFDHCSNNIFNFLDQKTEANKLAGKMSSFVYRKYPEFFPVKRRLTKLLDWSWTIGICRTKTQ